MNCSQKIKLVYFWVVPLILCLMCLLSGCKKHNIVNRNIETLESPGTDAITESTSNDEWLGGWENAGTQEHSESTSNYIRQRWAQNVKINEVARIELVCHNGTQPYALYTGKNMEPLIKLINSIDGEFVESPIVAGKSNEIYLSDLYVIMNDGTRYIITKIAGVDCNYFAIDNSAFVCNDDLFNQFPSIGVSEIPSNYVIAGEPPEEDIPKDQISTPYNIAPEASSLPRPEDYSTYKWITNLRTTDVAYIEFVNLYDSKTPYRKYEGEDIQEIIDLFQANTCFKYAPTVQWNGYYTNEFHIILNDGSAHKVCSIGTVITVIDGAGFDTISEWIISDWPKTGIEPLPDGWFQTVASREYHVENSEASIHSTSDYDVQRNALDHSYNTDVNMGSKSRNYFIGRNVIELSAKSAMPTGAAIQAYWYTAGDGVQINIMPRYWLEIWHEDPISGAKGYTEVDAINLLYSSEQHLVKDDTLEWNLNWAESYGKLEPGYYRVGMTLYEEDNAEKRDQVICYVKFCISEDE